MGPGPSRERPGGDRLALALVGARAVGKTSVGLRLAQRFDCESLDLDGCTLELARADGAGASSAGELLAEVGEERFRSWEARALAGLSRRSQPCVLATGGGVVERPENRLWLRSRSLCVWLVSDPVRLAARMEADDALRPALLAGLAPVDEIRELLRRRDPLWAEVASHRIDVGDDTIDGVVERIEELVALDCERGSVFRTKDGGERTI